MFTFSETLQRRFAALHSTADFWSLRHIRETTERYWVRRNVALAPSFTDDAGAMLSVRIAGVEAYAATSDLSQAGLQVALDQAEHLVRQLAGRNLLDMQELPVPHEQADDVMPGYEQSLASPAHWYELLAAESARVPADERMVDWYAGLTFTATEQIYLNSVGARLRRAQRYVFPQLGVTASDGADSQHRSFGGMHLARQGSSEVIDHLGLVGTASRIADEALQLLLAPNTPSGHRDLLLTPDQMILQIHESIGHPLELDRILGDERNFAGTSFIRQDDFGSYQYGSPLLNVTFDPTVSGELASYRHDDDGTPAQREYLIREGVLQRPLGGALSQWRSGLDGVANSRACSWNRPTLDRMANLNIEPGTKALDELIGSIERGILMSNNRSWSIDDARNKFQFGCEWGQLIEDGELKTVVKNPNYRGISERFWRNLKGLGDASTFEMLGTPYCGKGEPNQVIRVGHATPACVFADIDVFGGAA
ncbi:TldD/PmbA family protein [Stutzerimonas zhaodongensis]|uniref:TldD/PmbA family protein n=1 Tax=Stutzerimonas zhaodongensis TaxID=1176257 RepID=A0A3M2HPU7_9GAMM|nr:TldD/PmbA family protein [Stutzerimonas zhaodongensis]MCQ4317983.1 TldD/PmbA family protein [Stutzerimonas zhaodongensis]RMH87764.1 TldD/PmbA family protein [Stutzerimonas zhaodongensis]